MSYATLILGESGTGKSASLRSMIASDTLVIQATKKPMPFKAAGWSHFNKETNTKGNIFVSDDSEKIMAIMRQTRRKIIVLDDFQYVLANEFMRRSHETGFQKFSDIGRHAWDVLTLANTLPDDVRVYILGHTSTDEFGTTKMKTIGKLLDDKITCEGMFTIVLKTIVSDGNYRFSTVNNGRDTVKCPMGLFGDATIDNDLAAVDLAITQFYEIPQQLKQAA